MRKLSPSPLEAPFDAAAIAAARSAWAGWEGVEPELTNSIAMKFVLISPGKFQMGSPANGFGLHDMHANVSKWCEYWYEFYESSSSIRQNHGRILW